MLLGLHQVMAIVLIHSLKKDDSIMEWTSVHEKALLFMPLEMEQ